MIRPRIGRNYRCYLVVEVYNLRVPFSQRSHLTYFEKQIPGRKQTTLIHGVVAVALAVWLVLRIALWIDIGPTELEVGQSVRAFLVGTWFDLATLAYLVVPLMLIGAILPDRLRGARPILVLRQAAFVFIIAALLFGAVSEYIFWAEFTTRLNFIAVDYLIYTSEVIGNIRQSYPVGLVLAGIAIVAALSAWLISRKVEFATTPLRWKRRILLAVAAVALPLASYFFADIEQMNGAGNEHARELSGNGLFSLAAAMRRNELDYDQFYRTIPQEEADAILHAQGVERPQLSRVSAMKEDEHELEELGPFTRNPRNVILISVESLSAEFLGVYGGTRHLTPRLDQLAAEGLRFANVFATGTRTVRGLEALSVGTPPIPGQAILRRPNNDHLISIGQFLALQGFTPYFIYGGYGYFDNMNAFFAANDYQVVDRTDFLKSSVVFENIWGVADETLFANTLRVLDEPAARSKPFFAHIMTTSNHRPFTYPDNRIDIPSPGGRDGGVKYTDFAIGQFIDQARSKPWFKDTLFVIVADHCAAVAGKTKLPLAGYRIPLIFFAPDMLKPGVFSPMVSQIDIPPTLLDLLNAKGGDQYFGDSIFENAGRARRALVSNYQELGYYKNDLLTVLSPRQKAEAFRIEPSTLAAVPAPIDPVLLNEAIAYYQTAARAFKRNALRNPDYREPH
ncbi:MAG: sulfatase-like hydrolase/transferase [Betaproteobacteria bacterium]